MSLGFFPVRRAPVQLSQSVTYAVQALMELAEYSEGSPISCSRLARRGRMPERFLLEVLRHLARNGIVESARGGGGGFVLAKPLDEISLLEVIEAIDGPLGASVPGKTHFPEGTGERLEKAIRQVAEQARQHLGQIRLADVAAAAGPGHLVAGRV